MPCRWAHPKRVQTALELLVDPTESLFEASVHTPAPGEPHQAEPHIGTYVVFTLGHLLEQLSEELPDPALSRGRDLGHLRASEGGDAILVPNEKVGLGAVRGLEELHFEAAVSKARPGVLQARVGEERRLGKPPG